MKEKLSIRQRKFAEYYAQSGNTVQSAIKAGYSEKYANGRVYELLENVGVAEYIRSISDKQSRKRIISALKRQEILSDIAANRDGTQESAEGFQWSQWQVEQLKALAEYKSRNKKLFNGKFGKINENISTAIREAHSRGQMEQEEKILNAIKRGYKSGAGRFNGSVNTTGEFFKVNERKLNALINATTDDMKKAESAVLRMADDKYRKIIFDAQVYANAGGTTYEKAVDMATHDFLQAGLNCIEYKNGARHTISDYADMAIKTANKRAYLRGEAVKREEWGVHTVIVNKRGNPCPLCLPFVGRVLIDDVYGTGSKKDGDYTLLSEAMAEGFLHPRCQDSYTTYFEGISTPPEEETPTREEAEQIEENNKQNQKKQYAENQAEKLSRLSKYSLDSDNKRMYAARAEQWQKRAGSVDNSIKTIESLGGSDIIIKKEVPKMSINSIDLPIEQRNVGKGNPNAVLTFGTELNNRQKQLLELLSEFDSKITVPKKSVSMTDLSALTAHTGDEFAMFTKGGERLIIRGNAIKVNIDIPKARELSDNGYRWSGHTHPGTEFNCLIASSGDKTVLRCFNQSTSVIYNSKGEYLTFEKEG